MMHVDMLTIRSIVFLLALVFVIFPVRSMAADSWPGKIVKILDGASMDIAKPDETIERVKLYAVRVPTTDSPKGEAARQRTSSWCHQWGDVAEVQPIGQGPDGQMIARVIVGQEDLANVLTKACLASVDVPVCQKDGTMDCVGWHAWELQCRDEQKGMWAPSSN